MRGRRPGHSHRPVRVRIISWHYVPVPAQGIDGGVVSTLTSCAAKAKLASGVQMQRQPACYRLEPFQVRERTGETAAVYDGVRRADPFTTTKETMTLPPADTSSQIPSGSPAGATRRTRTQMETLLVR
jgi:hypothetical protein